METKKIIGTFLVMAGLVGMIPGILGIFEGTDVMGLNPWGLALVGIILFIAGIGLIRTVGIRTVGVRREIDL